tara:strand:- start:631 stop:2832 length:2202 start_codon:yes stop_codon:yes gene_type:complete
VVDYHVTATAARGLEGLLHKELEHLGWKELSDSVGAVTGQCDIETIYRTCLGSRIASRVLLALTTVKITDAEDLYRHVIEFPWQEHVSLPRSICIDFNGTSDEIRNTHFGSLKIKDAFCDWSRDYFGKRPVVDKKTPHLRINAFLDKWSNLTLALDLSGDPLHKRGYRVAGVEAPIKENVAAALLQRIGWPDSFSPESSIVDPMCGSGTFLIEGALMALGIAPGIYRSRYGFFPWKGHQSEVWQSLLEKEKLKLEAIESGSVIAFGFDKDEKAILAAKSNMEKAGLSKVINVEQRDFTKHQLPKAHMNRGLIITNPPYGKRLDDVDSLYRLYSRLGKTCKDEFAGWVLGLITPEQSLAHQLRLRADKKNKVYNGALECEFYQYRLSQSTTKQAVEALDQASPLNESNKVKASDETDLVLSEGAKFLVNRLLKNQKKLSRWLKREGINCYRLYDADLPEYKFAIDVYDGNYHLQEYKAPKSVPLEDQQRRAKEVVLAVMQAFGLSNRQVSTKLRQSNARDNYRKLADTQHRQVVDEYGAKFEVNLFDYLDTGLFLDHRPMRRWIRENANNKRFLNLFCYTGAVTISAALGGAVVTDSVDLSKTYLAWAQRNIQLNGLDASCHSLINQDVMQFLETSSNQYELIFVDPPTFSNSKKLDGVFDVQLQHVELIEKAMRHLVPDGTLIFSNNFQKFKLDERLSTMFNVEEITAQTLDMDYARNKKIHQCWRITHDNNK